MRVAASLFTLAAFAPFLWCQTGDLETQLNSLRGDVENGGQKAVSDRLQAICKTTVLAGCEKWGLALAAELQPQDPAAKKAAVASVLESLRLLRHAVGGAPSEDSATVALVYGSMESDLGRLPEAAEALKEAQTAFDKVRGPDDPRNSDPLVRLAQVYYQQKAYSDAEPLLLRALGLLDATGQESAYTVIALTGLAEVYQSQGNYAKALPRRVRAWEIVGKVAPGSDLDLLTSNNLGELYHTLQEYAKAEPLYRRALALVEKASGAESPDAAVCLDNLASLYSDQEAFEKAEPLFLRSLEIRKKTAGAESAETALGLTNLGTLYFRRGEYPKAEDLYRQALDIREKILPPADADIGASLHNLAEVLLEQGAYAAAEPLYLRALDIREKALPPNHPDTATTLISLGVLYWTGSDYARAEPLFLRALAIREKAFPPGHPDIGQSLNSLALLYASQGAYAKAEPLYRRAIAMAEKVYGPEHRETAVSVLNLAEVYRQQSGYAQAEPLYLRGVAILEKVLPPGHPDTATAIGDLALLYLAERAYAKAEPLFLRVLDNQKTAFGPDNRETAIAQNNLAGLYYAQRDYAKAEPLHAAALETFQRTLGPHHVDTLSVRIDYSRDLWQLGKRREACDQLTAANRAVAGFWSQSLVAVEEERRRILAHKFDDLAIFSLNMADALRASNPSEASTLAGLAIAARKGVRSSASQEVFARIRRDRRPETVALFQQLMANAGQQGRWSRETGTQARQKLQQLIRQESEIEKALIDKSASYREWSTAVEPAQIAAAIPAGSALIDVLRYPQVDLATGHPQGTRYAAVVYRSGQEATFVSFGPAGPLEKAVSDLRSNFANMWRRCTPSDGCTGDGQRVLISGEQFQANLDHTQADCARLYRLTLANIREAVGDAKQLIVSPDAALAEIPWEILRDATGPTGRYLVEAGYRIRYLDSARSIVHPPAQAEPRTNAVVIAQVDYDGEPRAASLTAGLEVYKWEIEETPAGIEDQAGMGGWKPLHGGAEILRTLRELQRTGKIGAIDKLPLGSEEEVMALERPAALIAHTHGFFRAATPGSRLGQGGLDSGIVLYGANRASAAGRNGGEGWLTAKEVMLIDLEGTRLVALLGCDTGRGAEAGEGVQGLRHALSVAGARSTLLTLWEVGDVSAARFLRELLTRSVPDSSKTLGDALAETQRAFLRGEVREPNTPSKANRWRHPYFWAAATLAGEDGVLNLAACAQRPYVLAANSSGRAWGWEESGLPEPISPIARHIANFWRRQNRQTKSAAKDMWGLTWVGRGLIFSEARNLLKRLVAGEGFEPSTFGL